MNPWLAAAIAMLPPLAIPAVRCLYGSLGSRLVALELTSVVTSLVLVCLSLAFTQPSFLDLALSLVLLSLPGTLIIAAFLERWL